MDSIFRNTLNFRKNRSNVDLWRTNSLINLRKINETSDSTVESSSPNKSKIRIFNRSWNTLVTIVLVEAKCLPPVPDDGESHHVYCKFRLGSETFKSKSVPSSQNPKWKERFQLHLHHEYVLHVSLFDKGKMKNSMGSCLLDLSIYEKERTHEIWQKLDDGYGLIHLAVTMCEIRNAEAPTNGSLDTRECEEKHSVLKLSNDWNVVGILHVNVICARGLNYKSNAYCTLEIDNERIETHRVRASAEQKWNKCYVFKVYDVTSTLDLKVYDSSLTNAILNDSIGKVSIPLLRITNDVTRWYALKERNKRTNAKGNCPRILLQMSLVWSPVKATIKLFKAKEVKYINKPPKFDVALVYNNIKFISDLLNFAVQLNEYYKRVFEWDDEKFSFFALLGWLLFCFYVRLWILPLFVLIPFLSNLIFKRRDNAGLPEHADDDVLDSVYVREDKSFTGKIQDLQNVTLTITKGIEYIVSHIERFYNLITFKVPFLSYVTMLLLVISSAGLYFIPFNYILMILGIYKFTRKYLYPERVLNNDLLDFLSRVPDNAELKDWKELGVPEPNQDSQVQSTRIIRSISTSI